MTPRVLAPDAPLEGRPVRPARRAEVFRRLTESLSGELSLGRVLERVVESAVALLGAEHGAVGLLVQTPDGPVVRVNTRLNRAAQPDLVEAGPGAGLWGRVLVERRPIVVDRYGDLDQPIRVDIADHALVSVPILWRGDLIGVLDVGAPPPRRFGDEDVETLAALARHAAVAIENARLFEAERRRSERIATINRVGRLLTASLSLDELLSRSVRVIADHLARDTVAVMLVDPDDPETLVLRARGGVYVDSPLGEYRQSIHTGIAGAAAHSRRPLLVNDVRADPRYIPIVGGGNLRAELAIPLVAGDRLLGLLNIESERPFAEEDLADFATVGDQLAIAVQNANRYAELQAQLEEMRLLYETSRRIGAAVSQDEVILAYLEQVASGGRYACAVALYGPDERGARSRVVVRGRWQPDEGVTLPHQEFPRTRDGLDPLLDAGQTAVIRDVRSDDRLPTFLREKQLQAGRPSLAMIPLAARGERIGLVILSSPTIQAWTDAELRPYQVTAAQLATAIDHRRQQELLLERGQQLAVLEERARLARELHDSVSQLVFSVTLVAQTLAAAWRRDPAEGERRVERLLQSSQLAQAELRALLAELHPDGPDRPPAEGTAVPGSLRVRRDGLAAALRHHLAVVAQDGLSLRVDAAGYIPQAEAHEEALYRIAQEAIANVAKHAGARRIDVRLGMDGAAARLTVTDDGGGFVVPEGPGAGATTPGFGLGLRSMKERATALGGSLRVASAPGEGTAVDIRLPRKDART